MDFVGLKLLFFNEIRNKSVSYGFLIKDSILSATKPTKPTTLYNTIYSSGVKPTYAFAQHYLCVTFEAVLGSWQDIFTVVTIL